MYERRVVPPKIPKLTEPGDSHYFDDYGDIDAGGGFVVLGPFSSGTLSKNDFYARLYAESTDDKAGYSIAGDFDFNGDGWDDVLVGVPGDDAGGTNAGAAYITFGATSW